MGNVSQSVSRQCNAALAFSEEQGKQFVLARVHEFRSAPRFFELKGSIRKNVLLDAVSFIARL